MALTIKARLILMGTLLAVVPTVIVGLILSENALEEGKAALQESAMKQLIISRELTANSIESYFSFIDTQVHTLAQNISTIDAAKSFSKAFDQIENRSSSNHLAAYYKDQFDVNFQKLNAGDSSDPAQLLAKLSPIARYYQENYISNNSAPLGEKDSLTSTGDNSAYDKTHQKFHPMFRDFQQKFGFYDVFIADAKTGHVIYSVFKELDFATSLKTGSYKDTGLGQAFKTAVDGNRKGKTYLTDFAPYGPSYNAAASFTSSPIFSEGEMIAVLIFQMPIDKIDAVMSHDSNWESSGLGKTGQTYLVGHDMIMRSNDRLLLENKLLFLEKIEVLEMTPHAHKEVISRDTTIGLLKVDTDSIKKALSGEEGFMLTNNYFNEASLAVYRPLKIFGMSWVIVSEVAQDEAFLPVEELRKKIFKTLSYVSIIALVVGALLGLLLANFIVKPILKMVDLMSNIAQGEGDLTQRLPDGGKDELSQLAKGINMFISHIDKTFSSILGSVVRLKPISLDISNVNDKLSSAANHQKNQAEKVSLCLVETQDSIERVEGELEKIRDASKQGNETVHSSDQVVLKVAEIMEELSTEIIEAVDSIIILKGDTDRITGVIDVINNIAEQTNLLALNAAIEAARAGEAGRGFAVVADEVRTLASKTRQSTDEVAQMVDAIQKATLDVVKRMEVSKSNAEQSLERSKEATESLAQVTNAMDMMTEKVEHISAAIFSQQENFSDMTSHYDGMKNGFLDINEQTKRSNNVGDDVTNLANNILTHINRFQVTDKKWSTEQRNKLRKNDDKNEPDN
jgi:methyl-accepting chemotaxis protein